MLALTLLAMTLQAFQRPPAPAPLAIEGEALRRDVDNYADRLRRACMSEAGVRVVGDDLLRWRQERGRGASQQPLLDETAAAALTTPINIDRLDRAKKAERDWQTAWSAANDARSIALLRLLAPADRAIYARQLTGMQPTILPRTCSVAPR